MIKNMGVIGNNYPADAIQVLASPDDIAVIAAKELNDLSFKGKSFVYIVSDVRTGAEVASMLGNAVGKPDLPWVEFKDEDIVKAFMNFATKDVAENFAEMGVSIRTGKIREDYNDSKSVIKGKTSLEDFATTFAKAYNS